MVSLTDFIDGCELGGVSLPPLSLPDSGRIVLSDRQREIIGEVTEVDPATGLPRYKTIGLSLPKRGGKTLILGAEIARVVTTVPESLSVVLGPSERGARLTLWNMVSDLLRAYPHVQIGKTEITNPSIGAQIVLVPSGEATIQGVSVRAGVTSWGAGGGAFVDEAHEYESDPRDQAAAAVGGAAHLLMSQAHDARSQCWLAGMIGVPSGLMGHNRALAEGGQVPGLSFVYEGGDVEALLRLNPLVTRGWLSQREQEIGPYWFGVHFLNLPAEEASGVFLRTDLEAAKQRGRDLRLHCPLTAEDWARLRDRWGWITLSMGLDRATSTRQFADRTVLSCLGRVDAGFALGKAPVLLVYLRVFEKGAGLDAILAETSGMTQRYGPARPWALAADITQCFDVVQAARKHAVNVEGLQERQTVQTEAFTALARYFVEGRMILPCPQTKRKSEDGTDSCQGCPRSRECPTAYLCRELLSLRMIASRTLETARFSAARGHDDAAHATALAAWGLGSRWERGTTETSEEVGDRETVADKIDRGEVHDVEPAADRLMRRLARKSARAMHKIGL